MIRPAFLIALTVIATIPAFASAQTEDGGAAVDPVSVARFPVTGDVPDLCILGDARIDGAAATTNIQSITGRVIRIADLADVNTLSTRGTQATVAFDAMCNYPYSVTVESRNNGLWRQSTADTTPVGFANGVPYLAQVAWNDLSVQLDADAKNRGPKAAAFSSTTANDGTLRLQLNILPGTTNVAANAPLVAGDYRDTLTITLGPQR